MTLCMTTRSLNSTTRSTTDKSIALPVNEVFVVVSLHSPHNRAVLCRRSTQQQQKKTEELTQNETDSSPLGGTYCTAMAAHSAANSSSPHPPIADMSPPADGGAATAARTAATRCCASSLRGLSAAPSRLPASPLSEAAPSRPALTRECRDGIKYVVHVTFVRWLLWGFAWHSIAQFTCSPRILFTNRPMMSVAEKTAVESKIWRSPLWKPSSGGQWRPGTGDVDGHRKI